MPEAQYLSVDPICIPIGSSMAITYRMAACSVASILLGSGGFSVDYVAHNALARKRGAPPRPVPELPQSPVLTEVDDLMFLLAIADRSGLLSAAHRKQVGDCTEHQGPAAAGFDLDVRAWGRLKAIGQDSTLAQPSGH
jgi:hypothetical protein